MRPSHLRRHFVLVACGLALGVTARADAALAQAADTSSRSEPRILYATAAQNALVRLNSDTAIAVAEGPASSTPLNGQSFGVDFNPAVDKIRVVSDAGQSLRLNVNEGTLRGSDANISSCTPQIVGSAYLNSGFSPNVAPSTMLFAVEATSDQIFLQNLPNYGNTSNPLPAAPAPTPTLAPVPTPTPSPPSPCMEGASGGAAAAFRGCRSEARADRAPSGPVGWFASAQPNELVDAHHKFPYHRPEHGRPMGRGT